CFGLIDDHHPWHFPVSHLVENQHRLDAFKLNGIGAFAEGAITRLAWGDHGGCLITRHAPNILVNRNSILVTWDEQRRPGFECGTCGRRVKHIYFDALACRTCLHLDYSSRHLHRSVPGVHRIMRWRRMIGIDPHPFAAIPERPKHTPAFTASLPESASKKASWSGT